MRVLLLGAGGMLGRDLRASAPPHVELIPCDRAGVELTEPGSLERAMERARPDLVINAAAYTKVDEAEKRESYAMAVNAEAVGRLGGLCAARDARVVQFSTDYVFPGTETTAYDEDDPVGPVNVYGRSKLAGEEALRGSGARALIIRTQWLFGLHGRSFPRTMWERAVARQRTRVVEDQVGRPTYTRHLASATWALIGIERVGVIHVANEGVASWYDVAARVFAAAGAPDMVTRCASEEYPTPARRPMYSVLSTDRLRTELGIELPHWKEGLDRFLVGLVGRSRPEGVSG